MIISPEDLPRCELVMPHLYFWNLWECGESWKFYFPHLDEFPSDSELSSVKGLVITGSHRMISEEMHVDFLAKLDDFVRKVYHDYPHIKLVGSCFGHQIIAHSLGGTVEKIADNCIMKLSNHKIHCSDLWNSLSESWETEEFSTFKNHREAVTKLPPEAKLLASTDESALDAYVIPGRALCFQAHPEFNRKYLAMRLIKNFKSYTDEERREKMDQVLDLTNADHSKSVLKMMHAFIKS